MGSGSNKRAKRASPILNDVSFVWNKRIEDEWNSENC
jgi:hypothetical protein